MLATHKTSFSAVPYAMHAVYADSVNQNQIANYINQHGTSVIVQSDWKETDPSKGAYIINKPNISDSIGKYLTTNKYVTEANLCSDIESNCSNVPLKSGNNIFTGNNNFTSGTITVPSNPTAIARPSTFGTCTDSNAVNVCDLLAVFDSLSNRIKGVYDSLKRLNDSLADELAALKNLIPPTAEAPAIMNLTSTTLTVQANNTTSGSPITSYEYCYSTNADMSSAVCQTSAYDTLDLDGLIPNTDYYFTVKATNIAGSTTSSITTAHTPAHAPTATVDNPTSAPTGFKVDVTDIDPKEKNDATTIQVCYKQGSSCSSGDDDFVCAAAQSVSSTETSNTQTITGLTPNTEYCVIVKVSNGDSTTIYGSYNVTTGDNITLNLTSTETGTVNLCGKTSVPVTYTATPSNGVNNYTYSWNGADNISSNIFTKNYAAAGTYTVTCTATHKTEGYTLTATATTIIGNTAAPVTLALCDNFLTVKVKNLSGNPNTISWGDGSTDNSVVRDVTAHTYTTSGTYTIIASNSSSGCTDTVKMTLGDAIHTTCTLSDLSTTSLLDNENGTSTVIDSVKDHEGNWYEVVQIGNQCWLKENLRTTTSPSTGTRIVVTGPIETHYSKSASWPENDSAKYAPKGYGLLYNWFAAVDTFKSSYGEVATSNQTDQAACTSLTFSGHRRGICPKGWHVPTDAEWSVMELEINGSDVSTFTNYRGSHACELAGGCDWGSGVSDDAPGSYNSTERNSSGFSAVPAGNFVNGEFQHIGGHASFWTSTEVYRVTSYYRSLGYDYSGVVRAGYARYVGMAVRCLRD